MRFAIVSDIHANLQAWMAVYADISAHQVDHIINMGDLVGYGPNPLEVTMMVRSQAHYHLLGNHDAAVCGKVETTNWNRYARQMIAWTQQCMSEESMTFFKGLFLSLSGRNFRCTHAEFTDPGTFYYLNKPEHAKMSWNKVSEQILFVGHTHRPALYVLGKSGKPHQIEPQSFVAEEGKRYLVNVGSVGFPRDIRDQSSYCIYDEETNVVYWRRIPFDYEGYVIALESRGIKDSPHQPDMTEIAEKAAVGGSDGVEVG